MGYQILCDDPGFEIRTTRTAGDAIVIARDVDADGKPNVRIATPDGETLPLRSFEILIGK